MLLDPFTGRVSPFVDGRSSCELCDVVELPPFRGSCACAHDCTCAACVADGLRQGCSTCVRGHRHPVYA